MNIRLLNWWTIGLVFLGIGELAMLWFARDTAVTYGNWLQIDGLSIFVAFTLTLALFLESRANNQYNWRSLGLLALGCVMVTTTSTLLIAITAIGLALLGSHRIFQYNHLSSMRALLHTLVNALRSIPLMLAGGASAAGYTMLALRDITMYTDRLAGSALDSLVFGLVLFGVALALLDLGIRKNHTLSLIPLWFYPFVRLYSLGPWNIGWGLAAALFGAALALWMAFKSLQHPYQGSGLAGCIAALALACFGLGTSAGIAAGCYTLLAAVALGSPDRELHNADNSWMVRVAFPLVAPFVAIWMTIGAAVAGGLIALAGVAWVIGLLSILSTMLFPHYHQPVRLRGFIGLVLGISAPLVITILISPTIAQLQGGLSPYGDMVIWPWVGMAAINSAQNQVAVLPSIAVATLMVVLVAMIWLIWRMRANTQLPTDTSTTTEPDWCWLFDMLRDEVPWLAKPGTQGRHSDTE